MKSICFLSLVAAAFLAGCGGGSPPALLNGSEQGVVVRYSQSSGDPSAAAAAADKFCGQYGRKAVQGEGSAMTGDTFVSFSCEKP